ncbi:MAG TPA: AtpZ/AtpI family protein [Anaerolineales bacterium]|nr:AtpZ/AtpI family protein [Anaerolineales bacterium]
MAKSDQAEAPVAGPMESRSGAPGMSEGLRLVGRASGVGISTGCLTAVGTLVALFAGMWLDGQMGTRPLFTLGFVLASIPLMLGMMTWWVLKESRRIAGDGRAAPGPKEET